MKKASITIGYDEEKLNALRLFLQQKDLELNTELEAFIGKLFNRTVPQNVRDYLELRDCVAPEKPTKKPSGQKSGPKSTVENLAG
jgi:hypothetical protein